jgi:hypothetical protein
LPVELRKKSSKISFEEKYGEGEVVLDSELAEKKRKEKILYDKYMLIKGEE